MPAVARAVWGRVMLWEGTHQAWPGRWCDGAEPHSLALWHVPACCTPQVQVLARHRHRLPSRLLQSRSLLPNVMLARTLVAAAPRRGRLAQLPLCLWLWQRQNRRSGRSMSMTTRSQGAAGGGGGGEEGRVRLAVCLCGNTWCAFGRFVSA